MLQLLVTALCCQLMLL